MVAKKCLEMELYKQHSEAKHREGKSTLNDLFSNLVILNHFCVVKARADK